VDADVRPNNQTHLPNLDNVGLVESVLRSAAFQNTPVPNASPVVGTSDVKSTVDSVINDVQQNPQNHDHPGLNPPALSNWVASQVDPATLAKFHPDLEPNVPGLTGDAKVDQWRANLASDLANGTPKRWDVVNAGLNTDGMKPGDVDMVNHVTQEVKQNGALPTSPDLVTHALQTPSWADSHVGSHLPVRRSLIGRTDTEAATEQQVELHDHLRAHGNPVQIELEIVAEDGPGQAVQAARRGAVHLQGAGLCERMGRTAGIEAAGHEAAAQFSGAGLGQQGIHRAGPAREIRVHAQLHLDIGNGAGGSRQKGDHQGKRGADGLHGRSPHK
jgi:hypothetical protein